MNIVHMQLIKTQVVLYLSADFKSSGKETIHLTIDKKSTPVFCKARCVPVRYCKLVKQELDRLAQQKIITKVYKC